MTLTQYLDLAYVMLVDEFRRLGANLTEALERLREYAAGGHKPRAVTVSVRGGVRAAAVGPHRRGASERAGPGGS